MYTLPETNISPENGWLEDEFPFGARPIFRGVNYQGPQPSLLHVNLNISIPTPHREHRNGRPSETLDEANLLINLPCKEP